MTSSTFNPVFYSINDFLKKEMPVNLDLTQTHELSVYFESEKDRDEFVELFPKYLKIKSGHLYRHNDMPLYSASAWMSGTNKVTGIFNETGSKKITSMYSRIMELLK